MGIFKRLFGQIDGKYRSLKAHYEANFRLKNACIWIKKQCFSNFFTLNFKVSLPIITFAVLKKTDHGKPFSYKERCETSRKASRQ